MSRKKHVDALFPGYGDGKPLFPPSLEDYIRFHNTHPICGATLKKAARKAGRFLEDLSFPETSDKYGWFRGLVFRRGGILGIGGRRVAVLVPWGQDWAKRNDSRADHYPTVYGAESAGEADDVVRKFVAALKEVTQ